MLLKILKPLLLSLLLSHTHFYLFKWLRYQFSFHNFFFLSLGFLMHIFMLVLLHIYYLYTYICMIHRNNIKNYVINNFIYHFFPFSLCMLSLTGSTTEGCVKGYDYDWWQNKAKGYRSSCRYLWWVVCKNQSQIFYTLNSC